MSSAAEPPNGDFVAYIDQLQRESAARILAQSKQAMVELPAGQVPASGRGTSTSVAARPVSAGNGGNGGFGFDNSAHGNDAAGSVLPLSRLEADKLLARLASERAKAQQVGTAISLVIGIALIFYWFASRAGVVPLLLGVGLLVWSIRKLRRGSAQRADARTQPGRDAISKVFGRPPHSP
jgi:hypothetical protein